MFSLKIALLAGFEPVSSVVESNYYDICATITAQGPRAIRR